MLNPMRYSRAQWLEKFESAVLKLCPKLRGRVNISNGFYYYGLGLTPFEAAEREVKGGR